MTDFPQGVDEHDFFTALRTQMLKFARLQLGDGSQAEDVVQEALEGAMKNAPSFHGKAAWRSWVFAILRHKIADALRYRYHAPVSLQDEGEEDFDALFDETGHWPAGERPVRWEQPDHAMEQAQFWRIFELCLSHVPQQPARAFMMREFIGLETPEICLALDISVSNLNVMLWRARMRLRECLSQRWFASGREQDA